MKSLILLFSLAVVTASCTSTKNSACCEMPAYQGSAGLQKMKSLAGVWKGEAPGPDGKIMPVKVEYRVVSAGSAVEERMNEGTPMEMISMYYDEGGKLAMTHYCALHNRPKLRAVSSTSDTLTFDMAPDCGINVAKEMHMHGAKFTFNDPQTLTQEWISYDKGKVQPPHVVTLKRKS